MFKKGDRVICIDPIYDLKKKGTIYKLENDSYISTFSGIEHVNIDGRGVFAERFVLDTPLTRAIYGAKND